jgi:hypothetical protein
VQNLLRTCGYEKKDHVSSNGDRAARPCGRQLRPALRLIARTKSVRSPFLIAIRNPHAETDAIVNIHRFEQTIGGRVYEIEVTASGDRWRAQLHRRPGALTAMMPFYAGTPQEAFQMLTQWLTLAYERHAARADPRPAVATPIRPAS